MDIKKIKPLLPIAEKFLSKAIGENKILFARKYEQNGNTYYISNIAYFENGQYKEEPCTIGQLLAPALSAMGKKGADLCGQIDEEVKNAVLNMSEEKGNGFFCRPKNGKIYIDIGHIFYRAGKTGEGINMPYGKGLQRTTLKEFIEAL